MKKFMLLYIGPPITVAGLSQPPLTQAVLRQWASTLGQALVDQGALFGPDGEGVIDNGTTEPAPFPLYGYSIVQTEDEGSAITLAQNHPFLTSKDKQGDYEIQVAELFSGDIPLSAYTEIPRATPSAFDAPTEPPTTEVPAAAPAAPQMPTVVTPTIPSPTRQDSAPAGDLRPSGSMNVSAMIRSVGMPISPAIR
jgi:hypothetical protein